VCGVVAEPHKAVQRNAVGVGNEVAVAVMRNVLRHVPGAHELADDLPAAGELKRDVDLGIGYRHCCPCYGRRCWCQARHAPPLGMGRGSDTAEIWR
jgi:hypothetical protein